MHQNNLWITHKQMILTPDVMEDGLVHMVYADEVSGNVLILIVVDKGLVPFTYAVNYSETWVS